MKKHLFARIVKTEDQYSIVCRACDWKGFDYDTESEAVDIGQRHNAHFHKGITVEGARTTFKTR
jgi:hypothetical protein